ncbi:MAG TPA: hypothetical protein VEV45_00235 [Streptosporangiaceae bacterium]|nr:hypothetical protein [Streptosporangiaceae bacterium]
MVHILPEQQARERQRDMLATAEAQRAGARARQHRRTVRRAERAEQRLINQWDQAIRLKARVRELELAR